jgi:hypothetical protein
MTVSVCLLSEDALSLAQNCVCLAITLNGFGSQLLCVLHLFLLCVFIDMGDSRGTVHASPLDYPVVPKKQREAVQRLVAPHVESFNYFLNEGLQKIAAAMEPVEIEAQGDRPTLKCTSFLLFSRVLSPDY